MELKKIIMKTIVSFFIFVVSLVNVIKAQSTPNAFNYSAMARYFNGQPISTNSIGVQITILKTSQTGAPQYCENHIVTTDVFGLFNLKIGGGTIQSGSIETIDWSTDNYYIKMGIDTSGGTNFLTSSITQMLSVPYALYAKTTQSIAGGGLGGYTHYIGEPFGGGVIFHLWKDEQGTEHGLIVDKTDLSTSQNWCDVNNILIGSSAQSSWDGVSNTNAIIAQFGNDCGAALCANSISGGFTDWYLPAIDELLVLYQNRIRVYEGLRTISGATELVRYYNFGDMIFYMSSTELSEEFFLHFNFFSGRDNHYFKDLGYHVRAIRSF